MHRIFDEGRRVLNSKPINHFTLEESATMSLLMGGGIGVTPMIALAYELHAQGRLFVLHSSAIRPDGAGFVDDLKEMLWSDKLCFHFSDQGTRAGLDEVLSVYQHDWHVYTCGPEQFMTAVLEAAERQGFPEKARNLEYSSVPEQPDYENHEITLQLARSHRSFTVPPDQSTTDVLTQNGFQVDVKCADGLCGVCKCGLLEGEVEHRDFVLSQSQQENAIILCQSRAAQPNGKITIDM